MADFAAKQSPGNAQTRSHSRRGQNKGGILCGIAQKAKPDYGEYFALHPEPDARKERPKKPGGWSIRKDFDKPGTRSTGGKFSWMVEPPGPKEIPLGPGRPALGASGG